jgi:hypothetical protein
MRAACIPRERKSVIRTKPGLGNPDIEGAEVGEIEHVFMVGDTQGLNAMILSIDLAEKGCRTYNCDTIRHLSSFIFHLSSSLFPLPSSLLPEQYLSKLLNFAVFSNFAALTQPVVSRRVESTLQRATPCSEAGAFFFPTDLTALTALTLVKAVPRLE